MKITLKALRINNGDTQKDLAKKLGVSDRTISFWELNKTYPNAKYINLICDIYKVTSDTIIFLNSNCSKTAKEEK